MQRPDRSSPSFQRVWRKRRKLQYIN